jgi:hypothetical protein
MISSSSGLQLQVTPVPGKLPQLRTALNERFGQKIWKYTVQADGTVVLRATMKGILTDVARCLEREGVAEVAFGVRRPPCTAR